MKTIPLGRPSIGQKEIDNVVKVLKSGWLTHGEFNQKLEEKINNYFGVKHCVLVNSCASALLVSLLAMDLPKDSEVIVPSFTFSASANAIITAGLKPVFIDVELETGNLDASLLDKLISKKTSAIMPVHFAGQTCDMTAIMKIAHKHRLKVVEDSAECIGGKWKNKYAGTYGDVGCFSFWATKNITTGEGGAVITNNRLLAEKMRTLAAHGVPTSTMQREKMTKPWLRNATMPGYNFRLSNLQAAVGVAQLDKLILLNKKRQKLATHLTNKLANVKNISTPIIKSNADHIYQMYPIRVNNLNRTELIKCLKENGIQASVHFDPPVHRQDFYRKFSRKSLPNTDKLSQSEITLPLYPDMTLKDIDYIAGVIKKFAL